MQVLGVGGRDRGRGQQDGNLAGNPVCPHSASKCKQSTCEPSEALVNVGAVLESLRDSGEAGWSSTAQITLSKKAFWFVPWYFLVIVPGTGGHGRMLSDLVSAARAQGPGKSAHFSLPDSPLRAGPLRVTQQAASLPVLLLLGTSGRGLTHIPWTVNSASPACGENGS